MRILYGIQGTGNGHITRAIEVIPYLKSNAKVDILISGIHSELKLPFKLKYQLHGLGFVFGKKGGIDYLKSFRKARLTRLFKDVRNIPIEKYDLVISDFEPVSAWAANLKDIPCVSFSNQYSLLLPGVPRPEKEEFFSKYIIQHYVPARFGYGIHFKQYNSQIFLPLIRRDLRNAQTSRKNHYTVYLPSEGDKKIFEILNEFKGIKFQVFSKHSKKAYIKDNLSFYPINPNQFAESMIKSTGVISNAGFTTASEALFLGKKLLVIPMKFQYEQQCNAIALKELGVKILPSFKKKHHDKLSDWFETNKQVQIDFPDQTGHIANTLLESLVKF
jgi:uncharacterized protein (TIGR00661 family)